MSWSTGDLNREKVQLESQVKEKENCGKLPNHSSRDPFLGRAIRLIAGLNEKKEQIIKRNLFLEVVMEQELKVLSWVRIDLYFLKVKAVNRNFFKYINRERRNPSVV